MKNSWPDVFVSQSGCMCVQAFSGIAPERLVGSGPAWHHSTRQNGGTTMVPAMGRLVAHGTCHRVKACKNFRGPLKVKRGDPPNPNWKSSEINE